MSDAAVAKAISGRLSAMQHFAAIFAIISVLREDTEFEATCLLKYNASIITRMCAMQPVPKSAKQKAYTVRTGRTVPGSKIDAMRR